MFSGICFLIRLSHHFSLFSVDFSQPVSSSFQSHSSQFVIQSNGQAQVVLSWWDLEMDPSGSVVCNMAPSWTYAKPKTTPVRQRTRQSIGFEANRPPADGCGAFQWRDHWMQSVYFLPEESRVAAGEELSLTVCHDDYSLWYSLKTRR